MADVLHRDRSRVMAAGVLLEYSRAKVRVGVPPDHSRAKVRVGVPPDHSRAKVRVGVLPDHSRAKVRVGVLPDHSRVKVRVGVLPDHSRVMAAAVALRAKAAVDALQDHHPVKAAEGATVAATVAEDKAVAAVRTISSRAAVSLNWSPASGNGTSLRRRQRAGDGRNIASFPSPVPTPPALKNHFPDQAPASVGA